jgi:DNA-binding LytR/AlgR family response regulator
VKTKCIIVDDEPLALEVMQAHLSKIDSFELVASCQNALEAFEVLNKKSIDLIFLDIQMPGMKGIDFLKNIKNPPKVIFTTAYREYALEGYELDVVDYILKPISFERFFKAVNKFYQSTPGNLIIHKNNDDFKESFVYVRANKKVNKIMLSDIIYIESIKDYITIHTKTRRITAKHTITSFEEKLPESEFLRIHRSYIVSLKHITGFTAVTIDVGDKELPIGGNYRQPVFKALNYSQLEE